MMKKKIGILGGLSPESTAVYYTAITRGHFKAAGNEHYPEILIYSVNFQKYSDFFSQGKWEEVGLDMAKVFEKLRSAGADFGLIASNTPHRSLEFVTPNTELPILSIIDATADSIIASGIKCVGLLGTRFTMQEDFYKVGLNKKGVDVIVPEDEDLIEVNRVIYEELVKGVVSEKSKERYIEIIGRLLKRGAMGIVLGCTEIQLLIKDGDVDISLFDTTKIHTKAALKYSTS